ncbi:MAG: SMP-30/gluconolactonase/LRE family protein [Verrucomicrobia bacterium]|nr:SMP-30/gluconolactonase/LRE family protein [Verrucomicrobiota bacterium]NBU07678.1 SMP-30/gluconolactonase/LRE family protein [Pseudomonadota bacterium]NDA66251.1 SMP-30/gluconolactonase/LRE family protein [Verrucomicrobiota bacterium]NDB75013.1 SMP-30/gluconolactonase/LRE family protein [Verrucomicrobiota bacterium]NDD37633.1 SMP-30/gluconolactonase/LRE family protein [Verrucomicrobiota bacterium]
MQPTRTFTVLALAWLVAAPLSAADRYSGLENAKYLGALQVEVTLPGTKNFTEGPAVDRDGMVYFTNTGEVLKWDPFRKQLSTFRKPANGANGQAFDRQGRLLACEAADGTNGCVTRIDLRRGGYTVLCDKFNGFPLGAPNDLCVDGSERIYFTSRLANTNPATGNVNAVYRIDPDGKVARVLAAPDIDMPNGLAVSPDNRTFYLIESDGRLNRARNIRAYDLQADGSLTNHRVLYTFYPGRGGDGMRLDAEGNLYVAAGLHKTRGTSETLDTRPGIHVITPQGKLVAFVETPEDTITNCAFGGLNGHTLYVTCGRLLLSLPTLIAGSPLYRVGR